MRALDQAGDVGEDKLLRHRQADDAELRVEGGEGVVGDLGTGGGRRGQERRFPRVGQPDQPGVGDQLQAQPDPPILPRPSLCRLARGAVGGGLKVRIPEPAIAALQQHHLHTRAIQVGQHRLLIVGEDLGADRHRNRDIRCAVPCLIAAGSVAALGRAEMLRVAEIDQRVQVLGRLKNNVPAASAIAAVRPAELDELLPPERDYTVAAVAGAQIDFRLVEELHRAIPEKQNGGRHMPTPVELSKKGCGVTRRRAPAGPACCFRAPQTRLTREPCPRTGA